MAPPRRPPKQKDALFQQVWELHFSEIDVRGFSCWRSPKGEAQHVVFLAQVRGLGPQAAEANCVSLMLVPQVLILGADVRMFSS